MIIHQVIYSFIYLFILFFWGFPFIYKTKIIGGNYI